ncbi:MAG: methylthioxylose transferase [Mycobacterium sp.]|nr:methylthioxylose transferase [Mycobacterium sp.]
MRSARRDVIAAILAVLLVAAAFVVPHLGLGIVTPLINSTPRQIQMYAEAAPIFGWWNAHVGWGTIPAVVIGGGTALWGPAIARRLPWRAVPWVTWAVSCAWAFTLAMIDGWQRGFAHRLATPNEYLRQVPTVTDIPYALHTFSSRIRDFQPDSWITHVSGHPPGALLTFVWLDRIGLTGGAWAGLLCLLVGSSAAAAIVVAARALSGEDLARRAAPFVAVAPTAIWIAVSADGYFAGVAAWGLALLALAVRATARTAIPAGVGAGLLLGWGIFLNYGLGLIALPAVAILIAAENARSALRAFLPAVLAALAVVGLFALVGFWWFDGYIAVQERYWQGIAANRPFQYWAWANFASVVCAVGLGTVAGVSRAFDLEMIKARSGLHLVILAALLAIVLADLSMLSKAEVERIWLPYTVWLTAAGALLPLRSHRWWLGLNVIGALVLNHVILTNW